MEIEWRENTQQQEKDKEENEIEFSVFLFVSLIPTWIWCTFNSANLEEMDLNWKWCGNGFEKFRKNSDDLW